jgi:hypothetical protein
MAVIVCQDRRFRLTFWLRNPYKYRVTSLRNMCCCCMTPGAPGVFGHVAFEVQFS